MRASRKAYGSDKIDFVKSDIKLLYHKEAVYENISLQLNSIPPKRKLSQFQHLKEIRFNTISGASIQMLIGADVPEMFCVGNIQKGPKGTPYTVETPLGWCFNDPFFPSKLLC